MALQKEVTISKLTGSRTIPAAYISIQDIIIRQVRIPVFGNDGVTVESHTIVWKAFFSIHVWESLAAKYSGIAQPIEIVPYEVQINAADTRNIHSILYSALKQSPILEGAIDV